MNDALKFFFRTYNNFIHFMFSGFQFIPGIGLGWIMLSIFIIMLIIKVVLNVPDVGRGKK